MSDHLITSRAMPATCPQCGAIVIAGHAEGYPAKCDPTPLDLAGEINARLAGRPTYDLWSVGGRIELVYRDSFRMAHRRWSVLAEHGCSAAGLIPSLRDPNDWWRQKKKPPKEAPPGQLQFSPANDPPPF